MNIQDLDGFLDDIRNGGWSYPVDCGRGTARPDGTGTVYAADVFARYPRDRQALMWEEFDSVDTLLADVASDMLEANRELVELDHNGAVVLDDSVPTAPAPEPPQG